MKLLFTKRWFKICALVILILLLCVGVWLVIQPKPKSIPETSAQPTKTIPTSVAYGVTPVVQNLRVPWSIVFTSQDRWLVSERQGSVRVIENGKLATQPLISFTVSSQSEEGLMGLALDPDYAQNKLVYACYAYANGNSLVDRVVRFKDNGTSAGTPSTIIDGIPAAVNHAGCRLSFGPVDKKLYITTGDATNKANAQNKTSLAGKILRISADGSIPSDNPFAGSAVWTLGHRNPQGLAWQPTTNELYATEHGPTAGGDAVVGGGDELNRITKGSNYGWPTIHHDQTDPRFVTPLFTATPAIAPAGATFYTGSLLPQFKNNLLFAGLKGEGIYRVIFDSENPQKILSRNKISDINVGRVRDIQQGSDGALYILTSNQDGRGKPRAGDDTIYRIAPK